MRLVYKDNIATIKEAYIFVSTKTKGNLMYAGAKERVQAYKELYEKILEFDKVEVFEDLNKADTEQALKGLKDRADKFEAGKGPLDLLAICINSIGFNMVDDYGPH